MLKQFMNWDKYNNSDAPKILVKLWLTFLQKFLAEKVKQPWICFGDFKNSYLNGFYPTDYDDIFLVPYCYQIHVIKKLNKIKNKYSRVHISSDEVFAKILKKPSIVQK